MSDTTQADPQPVERSEAYYKVAAVLAGDDPQAAFTGAATYCQDLVEAAYASLETDELRQGLRTAIIEWTDTFRKAVGAHAILDNASFV